MLYGEKANPKKPIPQAYALESIRGYNTHIFSPVYAIAAPVSVYVTFLRCPRCACLSFARGVKFGKTKASVRGRFHHTAFEYLLASEFRLACRFGLQVSDMDMMREFEHELRTIKRNVERSFRAEFQSVGADYEVEWSLLKKHLLGAYMILLKRLKSFAVKNDLEGFELARAFVPFREFEVFLSAPSLGFSGGKIDVLEDGIPVEIKTEEPPKTGILPHHELQLVYYALLLEYCTGIDVEYGEVYYIRINQRRMLRIDKEKRLFALRIRDEALKAFQKAEPPNISCKLCASVRKGYFA